MNTPKQTLLEKRISRRDALKAGGITALGLAFSRPVIQTIHPRPASANLSPVGRCSVIEFTQPGTITGPIKIELNGEYIYTSINPLFDCSDCGPEKCLAEDFVENWRLIDENGNILATTSSSSIPGITLMDGFAVSGKNEQVKIHVNFGVMAPLLDVHLTSDWVVTCFRDNCEADTRKLTSVPLTIRFDFGFS